MWQEVEAFYSEWSSFTSTKSFFEADRWNAAHADNRWYVLTTLLLKQPCDWFA
jgi:hypothetical protein